MSVPSGATLAVVTKGEHGIGNHFIGYLSGTYTAADFTIDYSDGLGFSPVAARVCNLTDRNETYGTDQSANGLVSVAAGTRTLAAHGITFGDRSLTVDVSVAGPVTDNDVVLIEAWG